MMNNLEAYENFLRTYQYCKNPYYELIDDKIIPIDKPSVIKRIIKSHLVYYIKKHLKSYGEKYQLFDDYSKIIIDNENTQYYRPDIYITDKEGIPILIIEFMNINRSKIFDKLENYKKINGICEIVIVESLILEVKKAFYDNGWQNKIYTEIDNLEFNSINLKLPMRNIYQNIYFDDYEGVFYIPEFTKNEP